MSEELEKLKQGFHQKYNNLMHVIKVKGFKDVTVHEREDLIRFSRGTESQGLIKEAQELVSKLTKEESQEES
jgi:hypothetical protein